MVHAQANVQHQVQTQDAVVKPRENRPGCCTIRDSKHQKPPTMQNERQIDHSGEKRLRPMAATQPLLTQKGSSQEGQCVFAFGVSCATVTKANDSLGSTII